MNKGDDNIFTDLVIQYFSGNMHEDDLHKLNAWIESSEDHKKYFDHMRELWLAAQIAENHYKFDAKIGFDIFKAKVLNKESGNKATPTRKLYISFTRIAAIFIGAFLLGAGVLLFTDYVVSNQQEQILTEVIVPRGSGTTMRLSDGTLVQLNSGSKLSYKKSFGDTDREVWLDGEGFFNVAEDKKRSFIIKTEFINIRAFGTQFNVKAYKEDDYAQTTLVEGSVGVYKVKNNDKPPIMMMPDQHAVFNKETGNITVENVDVELFTSWRDGRVYFENESFSTIAKTIERKFNYPIKISDEELKNGVFSGSFDLERSVYQLLDGMGEFGNFSYKVQNDTIFIQ
ncbi:MAG: DUF4974 domain-containing protein [Salinivirgaceae bacterium]|jgi:transmembrane sensor|nr:DUF4974 domain-containing protein [Salinivirgaceae bacterium]